MFKSKASSESWCDLYDDRNHILKEIFSAQIYKKRDNVIKNSKDMFINCSTGLGRFFGEICLQIGENIATAIELKICSNCKTTRGKILPFLAIGSDDVDLCNIQKSISPGRQDRLCSDCKRQCTIDKVYNDILVLEVEPIIDIPLQRSVAIENLTDTITVGTKYKLFAVIQFVPKINHFLSHVKRKSGTWKTYDDLSSTETDTDVTEEILPYMLFYINDGYKLAFKNDFQTTLLSFFHNDKLRKPLMRKVKIRLNVTVL